MLKRLIILVLVLSSFTSTASSEWPLMAVTTELKLLQYLDNGEAKGPSAEIYKLLLKESKLTAPLDFLPWSRTFNIASNRPNTLIFSMVRSQEREANFHWILKVSELVRAFISLKDQPHHHVRLIADAKEKLIAVVRNSYSYDSLIRLGFSKHKNIYEVASLTDGIKLFLSGKVDLLYTDPSVLVNYLASIDQNSEDVISIHVLPQTRRDSYIAANINTAPEILAQLHAGAARVKAQPDYSYFLAYKPLISANE